MDMSDTGSLDEAFDALSTFCASRASRELRGYWLGLGLSPEPLVHWIAAGNIVDSTWSLSLHVARQYGQSGWSIYRGLFFLYFSFFPFIFSFPALPSQHLCEIHQLSEFSEYFVFYQIILTQIT